MHAHSEIMELVVSVCQSVSCMQQSQFIYVHFCILGHITERTLLRVYPALLDCDCKMAQDVCRNGAKVL